MIMAIKLREHVVSIECIHCHRTFSFEIDAPDYLAWEKGKLIQDAMPYLSDGERELIISQTCEECFDRMFKEEEE